MSGRHLLKLFVIYMQLHSSEGKGDRGKRTSDRVRTWDLCSIAESLHSSLLYLTSPSFLFHADHPGRVTLTKYCDSPPTTFNFLQSSPPKDVLPPGRSTTVRQFCIQEYCFSTTVFLKKGVACSVSNTDIRKPAKRQRTCSHCKEPGHTKTKEGVITYPQLAL